MKRIRTTVYTLSLYDSDEYLQRIITYPNRDSRIRNYPGGCAISSTRAYTANVLRGWRLLPKDKGYTIERLSYDH